MIGRYKPIHLLIVLPLLVSTLTCKAVSYAVESLAPTATATATFTATFTPPPPTSTSTPLPPTPTHTNPPPTDTPTLTYTPTIPPTETVPVTPSPQQLQILDEVWKTVNENYLYPDFNGLDWAGVYDEYRNAVESGLTDDEFYLAMDEMIARLGDDHSVFFSPTEAEQIDQDYAGEYDYVGIGVLTSVVNERDRLTILLVFPGSPAEQSGLSSHDSLLAIDGVPLVDEDGAHYYLLRGPEGSQVTLTVESPGELPRQVTLTRQRINSMLPVPYQVLISPQGKRVGYLMLTTFHDMNVDEQVGAALSMMTTGSGLDGLIIDNRYNGGGASDVLSNTLAYFVDGQVGHFERRNDRHPLIIDGRNIGGSQQVPVVVLVGKETASFGEIFAGVLRDTGRATVVGEITDGNVEILSVFNFQDGSRAWIAQQTFRPINHPEEDWEQTGIIPDLIVSSSWDLYSLEQDPAIIAALRQLDEK